MSLHDLRFRGGRLSYPTHRMTAPEWILPDYLEQARAVFEDAGDRVSRAGEAQAVPRSESFEALRWFLLPEDLAA